jgi:hypothetical protein
LVNRKTRGPTREAHYSQCGKSLYRNLFAHARPVGSDLKPHLAAG